MKTPTQKARRVMMVIAAVLLVVVLIEALWPSKDEELIKRPLVPDTAVKPHTSYFPVLKYDPCVYGDAVGGAWFYGAAKQDDMAKLCAKSTYYTGSFVAATKTNWVLPILWCDFDTRGRNYYEHAQYLADAGYGGPILVLNEPDNRSQCNRTPTEAAVIWRQFERILPDGKFVGPNITHAGTGWLDAWFKEYRRIYHEEPAVWRFAFHLYPWHVGEFQTIQQLCFVLESNDYECSQIWMTEMGTPTGSAELLYKLTRHVIEDGRFDRWYVFTNHAAEWPQYSTINMVTDQRNQLGEAWFAAVTDRPLPAYP